METVGIGIDIVDVGRVERILERRATFAERVFTAEEIEYCRRQASPAESFAARWAAREACRKALGGIDGMRWKDVRVERGTSGSPRLVLTGSALRRANECGVSDVLVSLAHERRTAVAFCVAVSR